MCLSTVYEENHGQRRKVCEYVSGVVTDGDAVTLTNLMGEEITVYGALKSMDFIKNIIVIEAAQ